MIAIPINSKTHGEHLFFIDGEDFDKIRGFKWGFSKNRDNNLYVARGKYNPVDKKISSIKLHRLIMNCPEGLEVDHIDGNTLNNCRSNLRICTKDENKRNRKKCSKQTTSIYKGVSFNAHANKYVASLRCNKIFIHLGVFAKQEDAAIAYNNAAVKHFGDFAKLNKVEV